jgi:MATE family multidrug resistance protein
MRQELSALLSLSWPVVLAEIGWVLMGIVDTISVGPLGPAAIGAVGTGSAIFMALMVFGMGVLFALDTFVARAFGAGHIDECHRWLVAGLWLAAGLAVVLTAAAWAVLALLPHSRIDEGVLALLRPYMAHLLWSVLPLLLYTVCRRYLQALHRVKPIMVAIVVANLVNALANWFLIYGPWGLPSFGVVGAAWATLLSRLLLLAWLVVVIGRMEWSLPAGMWQVPKRLDLRRCRRLLRQGIPAASQLLLEVGVFAAASVLAARISAEAAGAHQIVLQIAGFFFMVPLGLSAAAAVRVGHAVGRGDNTGARRAGWTALLLAAAVSLAVAALLVTVPRLLIGVFSSDHDVLTLGAMLLLVCALFQLFDAVQVVGTGALRGLGDTVTPMLLNLVAHWGVGLPLGYALCFWSGWGILGLWVGLAGGLALVGSAVTLAWHHVSRAPPLQVS